MAEFAPDLTDGPNSAELRLVFFQRQRRIDLTELVSRLVDVLVNDRVEDRAIHLLTVELDIAVASDFILLDNGSPVLLNLPFELFEQLRVLSLDVLLVGSARVSHDLVG